MAILWENFENQDFTTTHEQDQDEIINILLLGRGWGNHDAPNLTDTIILASLNTKYDAVTLFSIPRDLYVTYPDSKKTGKINGIYDSYLSLGHESAIEKLKEKVSEITQQEIDYYVNIDFQGFIKIIDILGWVEVVVPEDFIDYQYPTESGGYTTFILREGTWTIDGEVALKYARSRHSTSDFDRSLRQQQILTSLKDKILALGYFKDAKKIRELYSEMETNIETDIDIATLVKLGITFKTWWEKNIFSFNLNDTCFNGSPVCSTWGFLYVPQRDLFGGQSVLLIDGSDISSLSTYDLLQSYTNIIFNHQDVYKENHEIAVYNNTRTGFLANNFADVLIKYGLNVPKEALGSLREEEIIKSTVYYNTLIKDSKTLKLLKKYFDFDFVPVEYPKFTDNTNIQIEIVLSDDYNPIQYLSPIENNELWEKENITTF